MPTCSLTLNPPSFPSRSSYLENQMAVALGGRVAEELIYGPDNVTTGASGDFQQVRGWLDVGVCVWGGCE